MKKQIKWLSIFILLLSATLFADTKVKRTYRVVIKEVTQPAVMPSVFGGLMLIDLPSNKVTAVRVTDKKTVVFDSAVLCAYAQVGSVVEVVEYDNGLIAYIVSD